MLAKPLRWITSLVGGPEIEKRVEENFPSWTEFSQQKLEQAQENKSDLPVDLPAHRVHISSPLQWNFLFLLVVVGALALGYAQPDWAPIFIYGAILVIAAAALVVITRDGIFFHLEGQRLEEDAEMINQNSHGPATDGEPEQPGGFLQSLTGKKKTLFRSKLFQIHYQNVLRTFEQGSRRAWVNQESSVTDLHTLLTQRGMKLVWTFIEVLPQLGLLGTLIGLARMFLAFAGDAVLPETSIIAGFGTALGTTILANLFVLILRPLYMRNERTMNEILSTLQMLMAMFILPTQHFVLERTGFSGHSGAHPPAPPAAMLDDGGGQRLAKSIGELTTALETHSNATAGPARGAGAATELSQEVKATLQALQKSVSPAQVNFQHQVLGKLTDSMQGLAKRLDGVAVQGGKEQPGSKTLEHDLMQMRAMTHDTLILLEQIAGRLGNQEEIDPKMLSRNPALRASVFPEQSGSKGQFPRAGVQAPADKSKRAAPNPAQLKKRG